MPLMFLNGLDFPLYFLNPGSPNNKKKSRRKHTHTHTVMTDIMWFLFTCV